LIDKLFFFSSRRRHTRFSRDWSSDVCSSDLKVSYVNANTGTANIIAPEQTQRSPCQKATHVDVVVGLGGTHVQMSDRPGDFILFFRTEGDLDFRIFFKAIAYIGGIDLRKYARRKSY